MRQLLLILMVVSSGVLAPGLSDQAGAPDRHLPAGRKLRPHVARLRREARRDLGPAGDHRVQARRRGVHRHGLRREAAERRLHLRGRQPRPGGRQPAALARAVQRREGLRGGVADLAGTQRAGGPCGFGVQVPQGHHQQRKIEPRQAQLRHERPGQRLASLERDAEEHHQGPGRGGAVQGRRAGHPGSSRRPDPVHLLRLAAGDVAHPRRQAARPLCDRHREIRADPRASDLPVRRPGPRGGQLVGRALSRRHVAGPSSTSCIRTR